MTTRSRQTQTTQPVQTANQIHPDYASAESADGVVFSSGNMIVDRNFQIPLEAQRWESTNGITVYTTVKWQDPITQLKRVSCNCLGWTMKKNGKVRRCKHTDDMMGIKSCNAKQVNVSTPIRTIREAEAVVPRFDGRELRGLMLD